MMIQREHISGITISYDEKRQQNSQSKELTFNESILITSADIMHYKKNGPGDMLIIDLFA